MSVGTAIYVATEGGGDPWSDIAGRLAEQGFVPWPALPPNYPLHPGETRELVYRPAAELAEGLSRRWSVLIWAPFEELFPFGCELSVTSGFLCVLAVRRDWRGRVAAKLYQAGRVLLKIGADPDDELPYLVPPPEPSHFDEAAARLGLTGTSGEALRRLGRRVGDAATVRVEDIVRGFGLPSPPQDLQGAKNGPGRYHLFLSKDSPLYRQA